MSTNNAHENPLGLLGSEEIPVISAVGENSIISTTVVDGMGVITSRYADPIWYLDGIPSNKSQALRRIDFRTMPEPMQSVVKEVMHRYMKRGRAGLPRPKGGSVRSLFDRSKRFFEYLHALGMNDLTKVTPIVISNYIANVRSHRTARGTPFTPGSLFQIFVSVEAVYELSQFTSSPMPQHPWPETSASSMSGFTGDGSRHRVGGTTPIIPDDVFCRVFERAHSMVEQGRRILDLRDIRDGKTISVSSNAPNHSKAKVARLRAAGWNHSQVELNRRINELRTACYIVVASTSGCRNHELANLQSGACHRTRSNDGDIYHWMRSKSEKTSAGIIEWMIPDIAVSALRIMERWATPYQAAIAKEISKRRTSNPLDPAITEAIKHRYSLFLGNYFKKDEVRTLSLRTWNSELKRFAKDSGTNWNLTSHQFRRKFANYAAHSKFGDLRYLRDHFAHWSMDMTIGYAMDENWGAHLDLDLYTEIEREYGITKDHTVNTWTQEDNLSGGYGQAFKKWQRDPENLIIFKSHKAMIASISESTSIRSNGHAWCTADNDSCIGNSLEKTRCGNCDHSVIGREFSPIYESLHSNLEELLDLPDIGEVGRARVARDLARCQNVLSQLEYEPQENLQ
ncbi:site-specific integrase [Pseudomonas khavaziana]|uniref:integrase n=1 Tax=Pseudomonas khavaziana TaxID=2842351 RepID=UPI001C3E0FD1|nr:integrase [Pseudomonas khavaziana]MBV4478631.1 integrase [Pseudomonas khavaziana]